MPEHAAKPGPAGESPELDGTPPGPAGESPGLDGTPPGPAGEPPEEDVEAVTAAVLTASRLLVAISARSLAAVEERVTLPQLRMLVVLATHREMKLAALAESLAVNPSTAMRMVERLTAADLTERRVNPASRREILLRLTDAGRQLVDEVTARRRAEVSAIVAAMSPAQRRGLVTALRAFSEAGGEPPVGAPIGGAMMPGWD